MQYYAMCAIASFGADETNVLPGQLARRGWATVHKSATGQQCPGTTTLFKGYFYC